jgi:hypothetical protein
LKQLLAFCRFGGHSGLEPIVIRRQSPNRFALFQDGLPQRGYGLQQRRSPTVPPAAGTYTFQNNKIASRRLRSLSSQVVSSAASSSQAICGRISRCSSTHCFTVCPRLPCSRNLYPQQGAWLNEAAAKMIFASTVDWLRLWRRRPFFGEDEAAINFIGASLLKARGEKTSNTTEGDWGARRKQASGGNNKRIQVFIQWSSRRRRQSTRYFEWKNKRFLCKREINMKRQRPPSANVLPRVALGCGHSHWTHFCISSPFRSSKYSLSLGLAHWGRCRLNRLP